MKTMCNSGMDGDNGTDGVNRHSLTENLENPDGKILTAACLAATLSVSMPRDGVALDYNLETVLSKWFEVRPGIDYRTKTMTTSIAYISLTPNGAKSLLALALANSKFTINQLSLCISWVNYTPTTTLHNTRDWFRVNKPRMGYERLVTSVREGMQFGSALSGLAFSIAKGAYYVDGYSAYNKQLPKPVNPDYILDRAVTGIWHLRGSYARAALNATRNLGLHFTVADKLGAVQWGNYNLAIRAMWQAATNSLIAGNYFDLDQYTTLRLELEPVEVVKRTAEEYFKEVAYPGVVSRCKGNHEEAEKVIRECLTSIIEPVII